MCVYIYIYRCVCENMYFIYFYTFVYIYIYSFCLCLGIQIYKTRTLSTSSRLECCKTSCTVLQQLPFPCPAHFIPPDHNINLFPGPQSPPTTALGPKPELDYARSVLHPSPKPQRPKPCKPHARKPNPKASRELYRRKPHDPH